LSVQQTHGGRAAGCQLTSIRFHGFGDGVDCTGGLEEERTEAPKPLAFLDAALAEESAQDEDEAKHALLEASRVRRQAPVAEGSLANWMRQEASKQLTRLMLTKKLNAEFAAVVYASPYERRLVDAIIPGVFWTERAGYCPSLQRSMREVTLDPEEPFTPLPGDLDLLLFARPAPDRLTIVMRAIAAHAKRHPGRNYTLACLPKRNASVDALMRQNMPVYVMETVTVVDLPWTVAPLEEDLFSLCMPELGRKMLTEPREAAEAVQWLENMLGGVVQAHGVDSPVFATGDSAVRIAKAAMASRTGLAGLKPKENLFSTEAMGAGGKAKGGQAFTPISQFVIMERSSDPITPLLLQVTYAGLVDAAYPTKEAAKDVMRKALPEDEWAELEIAFETSDEVWGELRGMPLDAARPALKTRSDSLNQQLGKFRNMNAKTKTSDLAQNLTIGGTTGRISELAVRLAVARESAMIKCHEKLLGQLTTWVASDMGADAVLCRPSDLMTVPLSLLWPPLALCTRPPSINCLDVCT